ncbi:acyl-CoA thioesterase-1 [Amphritea atlantica]|uniref:Acyl-CoA thioesterase-1 n=2 Tax=Amphritea atlantica TaxID=355243 RepID=A0A1H9JY09_9GAMM|nr:arylesterase [Amphritea atlantica]SEQ91836.1 acyl-CoA thioesterase-1 [Amphritea atlantica]
MSSLFGIILLLVSSLAWSGTVLVMGDSLSAAYGIPKDRGWVTLLEQRLNDSQFDYQVVNASISGETTHGGITRLPDLLDQYQPDIVLLELGANDGLRGAPLPVIKNNLSLLVSQSQSAGAQVLLLEMRIPPNYGPRYSDGFSGLFAQVAEQQGVPMVPFFMAPVVLQPQLMQADGLHPNAQAQPALLDQVWPFLKRLLSPQNQAG